MTQWLRKLGIDRNDKAALLRERIGHKPLLASEKRPVFLKENGDPRSLLRHAPLSRLAEATARAARSGLDARGVWQRFGTKWVIYRRATEYSSEQRTAKAV
jgi:hypothetical protein